MLNCFIKKKVSPLQQEKIKTRSLTDDIIEDNPQVILKNKMKEKVESCNVDKSNKT